MKVQESSRVHPLKTWPPYFEALLSGAKTFEVRKNDRNYAVGDTLLLREWSAEEGYSGRKLRFKVNYIMHGDNFGVEDGYCVMALAKIEEAECKHIPPSEPRWFPPCPKCGYCSPDISEAAVAARKTTTDRQ